MNPLQTNPATSKPLKNLPNKPADKSKNPNEAEGKINKPEVMPGKTLKNNKIEVVQNNKHADKGKDTIKGKGQKTPEIDEYLKMISRLENKVKKDEMADKDMKKVITSLEDKIKSLNEQQKQKLRNLKFFKKQGIENVKTLKKTLEHMFKDEVEQKTLFDFLKSQEFITVLLNEEDKANTYSPKKLNLNPNSKPNADSASKISAETKMKAPAVMKTSPMKASPAVRQT